MAFSGDDIRFGRKAGVGGNLEQGQPGLNTTLEILYVGMNPVASSPTPLRAVAYPSGSAPSSPPTAYLWWDSGDLDLKLYDGTSWQTIGGSGSGSDQFGFLLMGA